jgi:uncharacterized membrane protein YhaH (DUF805 family)
MPLHAAIITCFKKSFTLSGRASRSEFWWFWAFHFLVPLALFILLLALPPLQSSTAVAQFIVYLGLALYVVTLPGVFCAIIRRRHDMGKSGTAGAIIYGAVLLIVFTAIAYFAQEIASSNIFPRTRELALEAGVHESPAMALTTGPVLLISGLLEGLIFAVFLVATALTIAIPAAIALLVLGAGLARPSDPGPNKYGPNPSEMSL